uniref:ABC transporter ATP-binding protein n=1 Tax=Heterorhabditis bacteriophora TaxID=37862 RepID=A0A1I7WQC7_HETBA
MIYLDEATVLDDPRISAFITREGMGSIHESVTSDTQVKTRISCCISFENM